jgi:hypothetical protein
MQKYKEYINSLSNEYMTDRFNKDIELVKPKGYGIFFAGQRIKPIRGNVDHYPSINAALDALERNSKAFLDIKAKLMYDIHGWNWNTNNKAYLAYYFKPANPDGSSNGFLNDEVYQEYRDIEKAASNAMKHFVNRCRNTGELEIKEI